MQRIGVFVCHCGTNIAATVDVKKVVDVISKEPGVVHAEDYQYMCSETGQQKVIDAIQNEHLTGVVICSCSPRMHEGTFRKAAEKAGLNPYQLEIANIREQCSWIHKDMEEATEKAVILARAAVAKVMLDTPLTPGESRVVKRALVIGGGIAGIQTALDIADAGYEVDIVEKVQYQGRDISSTYVRKMLEEGDVKKADRLLGYDYFITGTVTHGRSIGHKKLYPTANLLPPPEKHLPRFGVYVTRVTADGKTYGGLTNIGKKPTIQGENPVGVETYLYDFDGDLYGKEIRVELLDFIRPEMRFDSIGQLKAQLDHDIGKCREIFRDSWIVQEKGKADG